MESDEFMGKVTRVYDGDTLDVREDNGHTNRIRLASIDTPELEQEYGAESKKLLAHLCLHKLVRVEVQDVDKYNRLVAHIYTATDKDDDDVYDNDVAEFMLVSGAAWHLSYFDKDDPCYNLHKELEQTARQNKEGLWQNLTPVPPWVWRRNHPRE